MNYEDLKKIFKSELTAIYSDSEISVLYSVFIEHFLGWATPEQRLNTKTKIVEEVENKLQKALSALKTGKPYQQILGETEFYGLKFNVNEHVLIPRPETEELIELAITKIKESPNFKPNLKILDIGTGSGIIPILLKKTFPKATVYSIDISKDALKIAKNNSDFHHVKIKFIEADYLSYELEGKFDVIISNPPYIGKSEITTIENSVKNYEPTIALFSPTEDALVFYRKIANDAQKHLSEHGFIFLEINQLLGNETLELFSNNFKNASLIKDISGNDRMIFAAH